MSTNASGADGPPVGNEGLEVRPLIDALRSAFPTKSDLTQFARLSLDINLDQIASGDDAWYRLVVHFDSVSRLSLLLEKALQERGSNELLQECLQCRTRLRERSPHQTPPSAPLPRARAPIPEDDDHSSPASGAAADSTEPSPLISLPIWIWSAPPEQLLSHIDEAISKAPSADLLWARAFALVSLGRYPDARAALREGDLLPPPLDRSCRAMSVGFLALRTGQYGDAFTSLHECTSGGMTTAIATDLLGQIERDANKVAMAESYFKLSLKLKEHLGDLRGAGITRSNLGRLCLYLGDAASAERHLSRNLENLDDVPPGKVGIIRCNLAEARLHLGDLFGAHELARGVLGDPSSLPRDLGFASIVDSEALALGGDLRAAHESVLMAVRFFDACKFKEGISLTEEITGLINLIEGNTFVATTRFAALDDLASRHGGWLWHTHRIRQRIRFATFARQDALAAQQVKHLRRLAIEHALPILHSLDPASINRNGWQSVAAAPDHLYKIQIEAPFPLSRHMHMRPLDPLDVFLFAERLCEHIALLGYAALGGDLVPREARRSMRPGFGNTFQRMREIFWAFHRHHGAALYTHQSDLFGFLHEFVRRRNSRVHAMRPVDRATDESRSLNSILAFARDFRVEISRASDVGRPLGLLTEFPDVLAFDGCIEGRRFPMTGVLEVRDKRLVALGWVRGIEGWMEY